MTACKHYMDCLECHRLHTEYHILKAFEREARRIVKESMP